MTIEFASHILNAAQLFHLLVSNIFTLCSFVQIQNHIYIIYKHCTDLFANKRGFLGTFVCDIFQDGGKRRHSNSSTNQDRHFKTIPILVTFTKWTIQV